MSRKVVSPNHIIELISANKVVRTLKCTDPIEIDFKTQISIKIIDCEFDLLKFSFQRLRSLNIISSSIERLNITSSLKGGIFQASNMNSEVVSIKGQFNSIISASKIKVWESESGESSFENKCIILHCGVEGVLKASSSSLKYVNLNGGFYVDDCSMEELFILYLAQENGYISESRINKLGFFGSMINPRVDIHDSRIKHLIFRKFLINKTNIESQIDFFNSNILKELKIFESDLNNVRFFRCNFQRLRASVNNAMVKDIVLDSIRWPNRRFAKLLDTKIEKSKKRRLEYEDHNELSNFYRHLKIASINQHDRANELKFYAFEMDEYQRSLNWRKRRNLPDIVNLGVSRITNYYGLNWLLPIGWYLVISIFLFHLISDYNIDFPNGNLKWFIDPDLARFLNPTHALKNLTIVNSDSFRNILLDLTTRLVQGFLVYQTVVAFRKHFRK